MNVKEYIKYLLAEGQRLESIGQYGIANEKYIEAHSLDLDNNNEQEKFINQIDLSTSYKFKELKTEENKKIKIGFIVYDNEDAFIKEIFQYLTLIYNVKLFYVKNNDDIINAIKWSEIIWLEWANRKVIFATNQLDLRSKFCIVRLHSYEALENFPININWKQVDSLVFVADHIKEIVKSYVPNLDHLTKTITIPNSQDCSKIPFKYRSKGFNLGILAYLDHNENLPLLLQILSKLVKIDKRYVLHVGGKFNEFRQEIYFKHLVAELGLRNNIKYYGWINDINSWFENINYLISTGIHEGHPLHVLEAMARGIKPIIHNYYGCKAQWPNNLIFNTIDEAIELISNNSYDSLSYRNYVESNYSFEIQMNHIISLFNTYDEQKQIARIRMLSNNSDYLIHLSQWFTNSKLPIFEKLYIFKKHLYFNFKSYARFSQMPPEPYEMIYNYSVEKFKHYNINGLDAKINLNGRKNVIIAILNGLDVKQAPIKMHFNMAVEFKKFGVDYILVSVLACNKFPNCEYSIEIFQKNQISYFIPKNENIYDATLELISHIKNYEVNILSVLFMSFYFSPESILILPFIQSLRIPIGRIVHQQPEEYFDNKIDFVVSGGLQSRFNKSSRIFDSIWPINTEAIENNSIDLHGEFSISKKFKIIVSIGRHNYFSSIEFWNYVLNVLKFNPNVCFVFIGIESNIFEAIEDKKIINHFQEFSNRIIFTGYVDKAERYLKFADIYLNTFPMSGGSTIGEAYFCNIPIISFYNPLVGNIIDPQQIGLSILSLYFNNPEIVYPKYPNYRYLLDLINNVINNDSETMKTLNSLRKFEINNLTYNKFIANLYEFIKTI